MHAVGEQRRGERVARKAAITHAIEGEGERTRAVDAPTVLRAQALVHRDTGAREGGASPTL